MNVKQIIVVFLMVIGIVLIFNYTPKYKIVMLPNEGFIRSQEGDPLYKNISAEEKNNWKDMGFSSLPVFIIGAILLLVLKTREKKFKIPIRPPEPISKDEFKQTIPPPDISQRDIPPPFNK